MIERFGNDAADVAVTQLALAHVSVATRADY
jgi:hypothetical protein